MTKKRIMLRFVFMLEVLVFGWFYYYGVCGMNEIYQIQKENKQIEQQIQVVQNEIAVRTQEVKAWKTDPFYKEKLAREQLHMAKEGEEIYLLTI